MKWGEVSFSPAFALTYTPSQIYLGIGFAMVFINLGKAHAQVRREKGFAFFDRAMVIYRGNDQSVILLPWAWLWLKTEILDTHFETVYINIRQGVNVFSTEARMIEDYAKQQVKRIFRYTHTCKDGTIQQRWAHTYIARIHWGMKWFPYPIRKKLFIQVSFDAPIGMRQLKEGAYEMKKGEQIEDTLRRMERTEKFD